MYGISQIQLINFELSFFSSFFEHKLILDKLYEHKSEYSVLYSS